MRSLALDCRGLSSVEYALLFVVIAIGTLAAWLKFGEALAGLFS